MNVPFFIAKHVTGSENSAFTRTIVRIAIVALALCLAVMIVTTALVRGFKQEISKKIFGFWGHIHIVNNEIVRSFEALPIEIDSAFVHELLKVDQVDYQEPARVFGRTMEGIYRDKTTKGGINRVQTFATIAGIIKVKSELEGVILKGIGGDYNWAFFSDYIEEGSILEYPSGEPGEGILLSRTTANRLQVSVGDRFIVHFVRDGKQRRKRFEVSGIYNTGLIEYDEKIALVDIRHIQNLLGWAPTEVGGYEIMLDHVSEIPIINEYIYYEALPNELYSESIDERFPGIFQWLALTDKNEWVILILMIIVSVINLTTVLLILILERTNMIGILKALGMKNWSIQKIFLYYAVRIIVKGLLIGNGIGLALCWLQDRFHLITLSEEDYYLSYAPIAVDFSVILLINVCLVIVTLVFLILPSFLVGRIDPVKSIRFK